LIILISLAVTTDGYVRKIDLYNAGIIGTLPSTIGMLSNLEYFDLAYTDISGTLPTSLGDLSSLQYFYVQYTSVVGQIPSSLGKLTSIVELYINHGSFTGTIPSQIGKMGAINVLGLNSNSLTGNIPATLGKLTALKFLYLDTNSLSGSVPEELCQDPLLQLLLYSDTTSFTGNELLTCIPRCLSIVANIKEYDSTNEPIYYITPYLNLPYCTSGKYRIDFINDVKYTIFFIILLFLLLLFPQCLPVLRRLSPPKSRSSSPLYAIWCSPPPWRINTMLVAAVVDPLVPLALTLPPP